MINKIVQSMADLMSGIKDGSVVLLGGFGSVGQPNALLDGLIAAATSHLKAGAKVRLTGLGILQIQDRPARSGRNPATGEVIQIAASKKIAFRPGKELKDAL